jgi:hypothetical protein
MSVDEGWLSAAQLGAAVAEALGGAAFAGEDGQQRATLVAGARTRSAAASETRAPNAHAVPQRADCLASEGVVAMPSQAPLGLNLKARLQGGGARAADTNLPARQAHV